MWRRARRRFGIAAPRLSVRAHIPWYLRWSMMLPFVVGALALAWWAYGSGLELAGFHRGETEQELALLRQQVIELRGENLSLNDRVVQAERQLQIDQASNQETSKQLKNLTEENGRLQDDLAFFQNLTATRGKEGELGLHKLRLQADTIPGEYRVRGLLVQSGQRAKDFTGSFQIVASVIEAGKRTTRVFPQDESGNAQFPLAFKYYQRVEQTIQLPTDAQLLEVQIRIFEQGTREARLRQAIKPS
jgi:hypothetical protein